MGTMSLGEICASVGRQPGELTRRDLARALLTLPAAEALDALPGLRRELLAAGQPLTAGFWERTEQLLSDISAGAATAGDVRRWLEATGSAPTQFAAGGFLWPDEDERGPVAEEIYGRLVAHLESLVAAGEIDPDRLLAGDPDAVAAYERVQNDWLHAPLEDGREPIWAVTDEEDERFLAAWDDAEADARQVLGELVDEVGPRPCPEVELRGAVVRLQEMLHDDSGFHDLLRAIAGEPAALPTDDRELWTAVAAGVVTGGHLDPTDDRVVDVESHAAWLSLDHHDWIGAVVSLIRLGPGAAADADTLGRHVATFDVDEEVVDGPEVPDDGADVEDLEALGGDPFDEVEDYDVALASSLGFHTVTQLWRLLGAIDEEERLTELGWWGLPEALVQAWRPADEVR